VRKQADDCARASKVFSRTNQLRRLKKISLSLGDLGFRGTEDIRCL